MGRMNRLWLVLLVTLALVASGVTVAMAEGLTQEIPQILGLGEGGDDVSDETVAADVEEEEGEPGEPGDGSEAATEEEEAAEEPAGEEPLPDDALAGLTKIERDGFTVEMVDDTWILTVDDLSLEIPMERVNNHGAFVSALAKAAPKGQGHGAIIRAMAHSTLGKDGMFDSLSGEGDEEADQPEDATELGEDADADEGPEFSTTSKKNGKTKSVRASKSQKGGKKSGKK